MTFQRALALNVTIILWAAAAIPTPARAGQPPQAAAPSVATCDMKALERSEAEFKRQQTLRSFKAEAASAEGLRAAAAAYAAHADAATRCLRQPFTQTIDNGGLWFHTSGVAASDPYVTIGTKWGAGSPYPGGADVPGPGVAGGIVTYSYIPNGVSTGLEDAGSNLAIASLPGFQACFITKINTAFNAWSSVANIRFVQTTDNGVTYNQAGANGDIRIGAHPMDGASGMLAHAYYPPPNDASIAGDLHFDQGEAYRVIPARDRYRIVAIHGSGTARPWP